MPSIERLEDLLIASLNDPSERYPKAIERFYSHKVPRRFTKQYVMSHGGTKEDGLDLLQEAMVAFERNLRVKKYDPLSGKRPYKYYQGIVRKMWWDKWRRRKPTEPLPEKIDLEDMIDPEVVLLNKEGQRMLNEVVDLLQEPCSSVLKYYMLGYKNKRIAQETGLTKFGAVSRAIYKCRKKLQDLMNKRPKLKELLKSCFDE